MDFYVFIFKFIPFLSIITALALIATSVFAYLIRRTLLTKIMVLGFSVQIIGMIISVFSKYQGMFSKEYIDMSNSIIGLSISSMGMALGSVSFCIFLYKEYKISH